MTLPVRLVYVHGLTLSHPLEHDPYYGGDNVGGHALVSIYTWMETVMRDMMILGHLGMALLSFLEGKAC